MISTFRFREESNQCLSTLSNYLEHGRKGIITSEDQVNKKNQKKIKVKKRIFGSLKYKQRLNRELEILKEDKKKFKILCSKIDEYEKNNDQKLKDEKKSRKKFLEENKNEISKFFIIREKRRTESRKRIKRIIEYSKEKKLAMLERKEEVMSKFKEVQSLSEQRRQRITIWKQNIYRKKKTEFLIAFLSRFQILQSKLKKERKKRRKRKKNENFSNIINSYIKPYIQQKRREKAKKKFRIFKNYFGFAYIYIRFLKKKEAVEMIKDSLDKFKKSNKVTIVYKKFRHKVRNAQFLIKQYLEFKKARRMMNLLKYKVEESKFILKSKEFKKMYSNYPAQNSLKNYLKNSQIVSVHSNDGFKRGLSFTLEKQMDLKRKGNKRSEELRKTRMLNRIITHKSVLDFSNLPSRFVFVRPLYKLVISMLEHEFRRIFMERKRKGIEFLEFNTSQIQKNQNSHSFVVLEEPELPFFLLDDETISLIVGGCFKKVKQYEKKKNKQVQSKNITVFEIVEISRNYETGTDKLNSTLYEYFGKDVFFRYDYLFKKANRECKRIQGAKTN